MGADVTASPHSPNSSRLTWVGQAVACWAGRRPSDCPKRRFPLSGPPPGMEPSPRPDREPIEANPPTGPQVRHQPGKPGFSPVGSPPGFPPAASLSGSSVRKSLPVGTVRSGPASAARGLLNRSGFPFSLGRGAFGLPGPVGFPGARAPVRPSGFRQNVGPKPSILSVPASFQVAPASIRLFEYRRNRFRPISEPVAKRRLPSCPLPVGVPCFPRGPKSCQERVPFSPGPRSEDRETVREGHLMENERSASKMEGLRPSSLSLALPSGAPAFEVDIPEGMPAASAFAAW